MLAILRVFPVILISGDIIICNIISCDILLVIFLPYTVIGIFCILDTNLLIIFTKTN